MNACSAPSPQYRLTYHHKQPAGFGAAFLAAMGLVAWLALPNTTWGHDPARTPPPDQERLILFPDTAGYQTLVVDLHTHSAFSDGHVWPRIRIGEALRDGLDALAITEHLEWQPHKVDIPNPDQNRAYEVAVAAAEGHDIMVIRGSEITRLPPAGHMNAVFIDDANALLRLEEEPASSSTLDYFLAANAWPAESAVQAANDQGAFVFWNHPWGFPRDDPSVITKMTDFHQHLIDAGQLHGIEIANGFFYAEEAFQMALDHNLTPIGVSDVHNLIDWDYQTATGGHRPVTLVFAKERTQEALKEALFAGRTVVWFKDMLLGREAHVVALLKAALNVKSASYRDGSYVVLVEITNDSDAPLRMRNRSDHMFFTEGDLVEVPPHGSTRLTIRPGELVAELELDFEVLNALVAPKQHARLRHLVKLEIPAAAESSSSD